MSPESGDVYALVGGRDFGESSFNRATQARRQAGSAFKPIIYAAALERGYAPGTLLKELDTPIEGAEDWLPNGEHERPEYTLRGALKVSSNRAAAQLLQQVGLTTALYYAQRLGIASHLPMVPSLALGTGEVTLLELTSAYSAFANKGSVASPRLLLRVEEADGSATLVLRRTSRPGDQPDHRLPDVEHAVRRRQFRHCDTRAGGRVHAAGRGQDRDDGRLRRCLVRRLHATPADWRLVRPRSAGADHARRLRGNRCRAGLGAFHERRDQRRRSRIGIACPQTSRRFRSAG